MKTVRHNLDGSQHDRLNGHHGRTKLKLLSYNVQVGISTKRRFDYIAQCWKHILPHTARHDNLRHIAALVRDFDVVGLQELDGGSFRTNFINQAEFLAREAGFQCWHEKINRNIGLVAKHSLGVLSRMNSTAVNRHKLPGGLPGRGALVVEFGQEHNSLALMLVHLSLGRKARKQQVEFLGDIIRQYEHVILMGDMNCRPDSEEMDLLKRRTGLKSSGCTMPSYPSWNPTHKLDHILVSSHIRIEQTKVLNYPLSDHLPVAMEITLPIHIGLHAQAYEECKNAA